MSESLLQNLILKSGLIKNRQANKIVRKIDWLEKLTEQTISNLRSGIKQSLIEKIIKLLQGQVQGLNFNLDYVPAGIDTESILSKKIISARQAAFLIKRLMMAD